MKKIAVSIIFLFLFNFCNWPLIDEGNNNTDTIELSDTRDQNTYQLASIGKQVWMAENLRFDYGISGDDTDEYLRIHGMLYNKDTAQNVCPAGFHLPSYNEWIELAEYIRADIESYPQSNRIWTEIGYHLKSTSSWEDWVAGNNETLSGNGVDTYGFNALGSGYGTYYDNGMYQRLWKGIYTRFWSSTPYYELGENEPSAYEKENPQYVWIELSHSGISESSFTIGNGNVNASMYSIRCIKD